MAFADGLVVMTESEQGLRRQFKILMSALEARGFQLNAKKSATLNIVAREKSWFCNSKDILKRNGETIPALGIVDAYKYLGVQVSAGMKNTILSRVTVRKWFRKLSAAPLKPQQMLHLLRIFMVPKLLHQLVFGGVSRRALKNIDFEIRSHVKAWL